MRRVRGDRARSGSAGLGRTRNGLVLLAGLYEIANDRDRDDDYAPPDICIPEGEPYLQCALISTSSRRSHSSFRNIE